MHDNSRKINAPLNKVERFPDFESTRLMNLLACFVDECYKVQSSELLKTLHVIPAHLSTEATIFAQFFVRNPVLI